MKQIHVFFMVFFLWTLVGVASKFAFLLVYQSLFSEIGTVIRLQTLRYGLRLDVAVAGYLTLIPGLLLMASYWKRWRILKWLWKSYFAFVAIIIAVSAYVANIGLYGCWGDLLDDTSLHYIRSSPTDAIPSMEWWQIILAALAIVMVALVIYKVMLSWPRVKVLGIRTKTGLSIGLLLLETLLLLPIRGGIDMGTNHTGSVYFSDNIRLNHAAVNPIFSFVEAVFYANSSRTDRAFDSIHSGLPAQPTTSVMYIPRKSTALPSVAGALVTKGYQTTFYYGNDINYSNMKSYFMGTGFLQIISDTVSPSCLRTGKWGVADGAVYDRMLKEIHENQCRKSFYNSIMPASSHEFFDVPDYHRIEDGPELNSFAYADECLGRFVELLKEMPCWKQTIVAIVADYLSVYPIIPDNYQLWRYRVPFIILGEALPIGIKCTNIGSQIDIAATLLAMAGANHQSFLCSMGVVTDSNNVVYNNTDDKIYQSAGLGTDSLLLKTKAYLQKTYDYIDI